MKNILVVVDMQNDFISGSLGTKEAEAIVPAVLKKIEKYQLEGNEILFTRDTHHMDYLSTQEGRNLPVEHCIAGTYGHEIASGLKSTDYKIFDKPTFGSLELCEYISGQTPDKIELVGLCTDICVISNALLLKAYVPEVEICIDASCCAGVTKSSHENALAAMKMCQVTII